MGTVDLKKRGKGVVPKPDELPDEKPPQKGVRKRRPVKQDELKPFMRQSTAAEELEREVRRDGSLDGDPRGLAGLLALLAISPAPVGQVQGHPEIVDCALGAAFQILRQAGELLFESRFRLNMR